MVECKDGEERSIPAKEIHRGSGPALHIRYCATLRRDVPYSMANFHIIAGEGFVL